MLPLKALDLRKLKIMWYGANLAQSQFLGILCSMYLYVIKSNREEYKSFPNQFTKQEWRKSGVVDLAHRHFLTNPSQRETRWHLVKYSEITD